MTKYIKITDKIVGKLNAKETYLFYCLSLNADLKDYKSNIKQETLANEYGIKDIDQIREWLYKFQSCGLLIISKTNVKGRYGKFQRCRYHLNTEHYVLISEVLKNEPISRQLKGFLIFSVVFLISTIFSVILIYFFRKFLQIQLIHFIFQKEHRFSQGQALR